MREEGWYVDPFGHHEARWISDGSPTALVRDGQIESKDPPPDVRIRELSNRYRTTPRLMVRTSTGPTTPSPPTRSPMSGRW
jgi:hypothetical protein